MAQRRKQSNPKPLKWEECLKEGEEAKAKEQKEGKEEDKDGLNLSTSKPSPGASQTSGGPHRKKLDLKDEVDEGVEEIRTEPSPPPVYSKRFKGDKVLSDLILARKLSAKPSAALLDMEEEEALVAGAGGGGSRRNSAKAQSSTLLETEDEGSAGEELSFKRTALLPDLPISVDLAGSGPIPHPRILQAGVPYLHLLPHAMRSDAARILFMPTILSPDLANAAAAVSSGQTTNQIVTNTAKNEKMAVEETVRIRPVFTCEPCNIKFSSVRTLEAHQTYYCAFRKDAGQDGEKSNNSDAECNSEKSMPTKVVVKPRARGDSSASETSPASFTKKRDRSSADEDRAGPANNDSNRSEDLEGALSAANKNAKTGKLYSCIYCSYSADKKVSLNRHMRMHSGPAQPSPSSGVGLANNVSPQQAEDSGAPGGVVAENKEKHLGDNPLDRYCQDCDIQFSSIKTYRVHKEYYCSTRHVVRAQQLAAAAAAVSVPSSSGSSPCQSSKQSGLDLVEGGRGTEGRGVRGKPNIPAPEVSISPVLPGSPPQLMMLPSPQQYVVLHTNPVIIVPYCFIQGAIPLSTNSLPTQNALVVLPNGSVHCLPSTSPTTVPFNSTPSGPFSSPAPQMARLLSPQHSSAAPGNSGANPNMATLTSLSPVFNDPKEILRKIWGPSAPSTSISLALSASDESSNEPQCCGGPSAREFPEGFKFTESLKCAEGFKCKDTFKLCRQSARSSHDSSSDMATITPTGVIWRASQESQPAIDLTLRGGVKSDDEKENRRVMYLLEQGHLSEGSVREARENGDRLLVTTSGREGEGKRARQSNNNGNSAHASTSGSSSACSSPPTLAEPKRNGILSGVSSILLVEN